MKTDLPPEAFTKETLQEAFNWLQTQPEALRESIHTPERLVSLYRKSQRLNDQDAPVSSKKFINDLKNLANSLDQFGGQEKTNKTFNFSEASTHKSRPSENQPNTAFAEPPKTFAQPTPPPQPQKSQQQVSFFQSLEQQTSSQAPTPQPSNQPAPPPAASTPVSQNTTNLPAPARTTAPNIDPLTQERIEKVRQRFNLSSDSEALRILVSLGFEKFSQFQ